MQPHEWHEGNGMHETMHTTDQGRAEHSVQLNHSHPPPKKGIQSYSRHEGHDVAGMMTLIAVAIPLAAGIPYPFGILLTPAAGAVLMSASTVIVAINSRFLKLAT
jgi:hypothetical protein